MKSKSILILFLAMFLPVVFLTNCKTKGKMPKTETKVDILCSGSQYFSSKEYFRANSVAESPNQANSKRMALSNARAELAGQIEVTIKAVIDNYFQDRTIADLQEFSQRYEGLSREVINQKLTGTRIICEEVTRTQDGKYKTYLAIELSGSEILNAMNQRISQEAKLRQDYDYEKFKTNFDSEMEKLEKERGY